MHVCHQEGKHPDDARHLQVQGEGGGVQLSDHAEGRQQHRVHSGRGRGGGGGARQHHPQQGGRRHTQVLQLQERGVAGGRGGRQGFCGQETRGRSHSQ